MRKVKEKKVILVTPNGIERAFGIAHAERLLDMGPAVNGGWTLRKDSEYCYTEENGLRLKPNKTDTAEAK